LLACSRASAPPALPAPTLHAHSPPPASASPPVRAGTASPELEQPARGRRPRNSAPCNVLPQ
jgi:hypothetical protein